MVELYIQGKKADTDKDIDIAITYQVTDTTKPTAIKNSFSKTINLVGTPTNNEIFGYIYKLDRSIIDNGELYGISFDPKKRVDFVLYENSDILEKGYLSLDKITSTNGVITYSITLFGQLGDFFYNLQSTEDGEEKTLADLYFGFSQEYHGTPMTKDEESTNTLMLWNAETIDSGWGNYYSRVSRTTQGEIVHNFDNTDMRPVNWIIAAPVYNGTNDDFKNDTFIAYCGRKEEGWKPLIAYDAFGEFNLNSDGEEKEMVTLPIARDTYDYFKYTNGWLTLTAQRELVEWEAKDLRSNQQRPAIKNELILNAISNPENNGGYEVVWDDEVKNSVYFKNTYLMLGRIDYDEVLNKRYVTMLEDLSKQTALDTGNTINTPIVFNGDSYIADTNNMINPQLVLSLQESIDVTADNMDYFTYLTFYKKYVLDDVYTCFSYRVKWNVDGVESFSPYYLVGYYANAAQIAEDNGISKYVNINRKGVKYNQKGNIGSFYWADTSTGDQKPIVIQMDAPKGKVVTATIERRYLHTNYNTSSVGSVGIYLAGESGLQGGGKFVSKVNLVGNTSDDNEFVSGLYDGETDKTQKMALTKKNLFANSDSPFNYLVSFTKMFDLRYVMDKGLKRVYIIPRKKYYIDEVHDISKLIDMSKGYEIKPTTVENKWYDYGFETPDTYANYLYSKRSKTGYGHKKYDTGYNFNFEVTDMLEDNVFKNVIPYKISSVYLRDKTLEGAYGGDYCPATFTTTYERNVRWLNSEGKIEDKDETLYGLAREDESMLTRVVDNTSRLCCFDKDNGYESGVDMALVFVDGMIDKFISVTDNLPIMSDLADDNCYIFTPVVKNTVKSQAMFGRTTIDAIGLSIIGYQEPRIPNISRYLSDGEGNYYASLDFMKPEYTLIKDESKYTDGIDIFSLYWRDYLNDIYDKDSKTVDLECFLPEKPQDAMRKFYYFGGSYWVLNTVTNYNPTKNEPVKCQFLKVKDKNAYLS